MTNQDLAALRERWHPSLQMPHYERCELEAFHEACAVNKLLDELEVRTVLLSELAEVSLNLTHSDHANPCYRTECSRCVREQELIHRLQEIAWSKEKRSEQTDNT